MSKSNFSEDFKRDAVRQITERGYRVSEVSQRLGVSFIAYDEILPLLRPFFERIFSKAPDMHAVATAPDLRILISMAQARTGWTVLPDYLCTEA